MKALSSFSSPSSCNENRRSTWCLSRILRRILCFNSLPMCPFDYLKEEEVKLDSSLSNPSATPGIVARLMGLDSIPHIDESPSTNSTDSFKKSKSRRLIIPVTYQELEDENFFIFSFESHVKRRKSGKNYERIKKKSVRRRESFQEREDKENKGVVKMVSKGNLLDDKEDSKISDGNQGNVLRPSKSKNSCSKLEKIRKKHARINIEIEGDSENSSPNSVLEFVEFPANQDASCSGSVSRLANSRMRRTLSEELEKYEKSKDKRLSINNNGYGGQEKVSRLMSNKLHHNVYANEISELAIKEVMKLSWVQDEVFRNKHHFKEIGRDIASQILDRLLNEMLINLE